MIKFGLRFFTTIDGTKNYLSNRNEGTLRYKVRNKQTIPLKTE
jgi:hypothetical protein